MNISRPSTTENPNTKLKCLYKLCYLIPFIHIALVILFWKEATDCYCRIFIINIVIVSFLCFSPISLLQFDYLTVVLFFLWIFKNSNSETVKTNAACLDTNDNLFFNFSFKFFTVAIWGLTAFMILLVIILMVTLTKDFILQTPHEGPGLAEDAINNLPLVKFQDYMHDNSVQRTKKEEECPICLESFQTDDELRMIPNCEHIYHADCIKTWLQANTVCPYCRGDLSNINSTTINKRHRSTFATNILNQIQEMSLISDIENQNGQNQQPLLNRR